MSKPYARKPAQDDSDDDESTSPKAPAGPYRTDPKGDELKKAGEKKLKSFSFFSSSNKYEDAIELFEKAAAQYKMNKNWQEAGETYRQCADIYRDNLKDVSSEGTMYENAAKAFKNVNTRECLSCYNSAVEILMENNKFSMGAKIWKEIGTLQEKEHDLKGALASYAKAADCYEADNATVAAGNMWVKVAGLAADVGDYKRAISVFEKVSKSAVENSALRWSVKGYLFKALLCHFALGAKTHRVSGVTTKMESYVDMCPDLDGSREHILIQDLLADFEESDADKFAEHLFKFDEIVKLDNWTSKVLLEIKRAIEAGNPEENTVGM